MLEYVLPFYNYTGKTYENLLVRKINFLTIRKPFMPGNRYIFILFNDGFYISIWHSFSFILWNKEWRLAIIEQCNAVYCIFLVWLVCGLPVRSGVVSGTHGAKNHQDTYWDSLSSITRSVLWERRAWEFEPLSPTSLVVIEICSVCDKVVCKEIPLCIKVPKII